MGEKGDRLTGTAADIAGRLVDDLAATPGISSKKMFGGVGIFAEGTMFIIVDSAGRVFFRVNDSTVGRFEEAGSEKHGRMPYWSVPETVLADRGQLEDWAQQALEAARGA